MSMAEELRTMIIAHLVADTTVSGLVGTRIFDDVPTGTAYPYISFGPSDRVPAPTYATTREITVQIDIWSSQQGQLMECENIVDAVDLALDRHDGTLATHNLASLVIDQARAFRDRDGITAHGIVQVTARINKAA